MKNRYSLRDIQQDPPVAYCDKCEGEIYEYDECYQTSGGIFCLRCVSPFDRGTYASIQGAELNSNYYVEDMTL